MSEKYKAVVQELEGIMKNEEGIYEGQEENEELLSKIVDIERRHLFGDGLASSSKRIKDIEEVLRKSIIEG